MNQWLNLFQVIKLLNAELGINEFTLRKIKSRIKKKDLKAINISFADSPIWKVKKEWVEEFKTRFFQEQKTIPSNWKPTEEEREEAILSSLSNKLGRKITMKELKEKLPELSPLQQQALTLRYGLEDGIFKSFEKVGKRMGVSKQRIIELEEGALKFLK